MSEPKPSKRGYIYDIIVEVVLESIPALFRVMVRLLSKLIEHIHI